MIERGDPGAPKSPLAKAFWRLHDRAKEQGQARSLPQASTAELEGIASLAEGRPGSELALLREKMLRVAEGAGDEVDPKTIEAFATAYELAHALVVRATRACRDVCGWVGEVSMSPSLFAIDSEILRAVDLQSQEDGGEGGGGEVASRRDPGSQPRRRCRFAPPALAGRRAGGRAPLLASMKAEQAAESVRASAGSGAPVSLAMLSAKASCLGLGFLPATAFSPSRGAHRPRLAARRKDEQVTPPRLTRTLDGGRSVTHVLLPFRWTWLPQSVRWHHGEAEAGACSG